MPQKWEWQFSWLAITHLRTNIDHFSHEQKINAWLYFRNDPEIKISYQNNIDGFVVKCTLRIQSKEILLELEKQIAII